jgi:hypothetical protein
MSSAPPRPRGPPTVPTSPPPCCFDGHGSWLSAHLIFLASRSSLAPILRRRARCSNASANASRCRMTRRSSVWTAPPSPRSSFVFAFFLKKCEHSISSLLHALFFLISSVTRATSTAARAFGIANQSQARPGCPCTRWGFSDFDFLSVD